MDKSHILKTFNDHFIEFIEDIIKVFPENSDLVAIKNSFINFRKLNPKLVIDVFRRYVIDKYSEEIDSNNVEFFINKNYESDFVYSKRSSMIIEKIDKLREPVRLMSVNDQENVLKYLKNLKKLSLLYNQ
jgi:hypothetical protein|tara:strand:- start:211 stop:600 length:390 start_codon:yes stop_codon:yes gene_type:complete